MKKCFLLFICLFMIFLAGCADISGSTSSSNVTENRPDPVTEYFKLQKNGDGTYDFEVLTISGAALISEKSYPIKPSAYLVSDTLLCLSAGGGESTRWTRYCELEQKTVSDTFYNVICETEQRVVYTEFKGNQHLVIVKDIFGTDGFYKEIILENASMDADPQLVKKNSEKTITVKYFTGLKKEPKTVELDIS